MTFSDGTTLVIDLPEAGTSGSLGAVDFAGFTDAGSSISSVTVVAGSPELGYDYIGVDDVSYQSAPANTVTPEPDFIVLILTGCLSLAAGIRRRYRV